MKGVAKIIIKIKEIDTRTISIESENDTKYAEVERQQKAENKELFVEKKQAGNLLTSHVQQEKLKS